MLKLHGIQNSRARHSGRRVLFATTGLLIYAATASAVPTLDFDLTVSSAGLLASVGSFDGASVRVSSVTASDTGQDGVFSCIECFLTLDTGAARTHASLSLFGDIDVDGDGVGDIPLGMRGDVFGPQVATITPSGRYQAGIVGGVSANYNAPFANFFGISPVSLGGVMVMMAWGGPSGADAASDGILRTIFRRVHLQPLPVPVEIPEPATTSLLAGAFLAAAALRSRKARR